MKYWKDIWSNLVFNAGNATTQYAANLKWRYQTGQIDGGIQYKSRSAYKSVLAHVARQLAMSTLEGELNDLLPKYQRHVRDVSLKTVRDQQEANRKVLIENREKCNEDFGWIDCTVKDAGTRNTTKHRFTAKDKYGTPVPEALILHYDLPDGEASIKYTDARLTTATENRGRLSIQKLRLGQDTKITDPAWVDDSFDSITVLHCDLAPKVSVNSTKNVVLTPVQGRDYTRKELVSGGDLTYSVSGEIDSGQEGVYPVEAVKRFVKIMQYNGIVNVNYITFGLLGITQLIIKDFSLGHPEYKNIQPYSFTCVAVEPDDSIKLQADTITAINKQLELSKWDEWYHVVLQNKLGEMATKTVLSTATSAVTSGASVGLDQLTTNI